MLSKTEIQKTCISDGFEFEIYPVEGETYPPDMRFTPAELVGRRFANFKGQQLICSHVEVNDDGTPSASFMPDFTKPMNNFYGMSGAKWDVNSVQWANMTKNLSGCQLTLNRLPQADVVYCVGSGPALMKNWPVLLEAKKNPRARIIGCNELLQYLPAGLLDYYLALDGSCPDKWWQGFDCSNTTAIFAPSIPPSFRRANWKKILWFKIGLESDFNKYVNRRAGHLTTLIPMYGVGPTQLQIAWLMKPKTVVLVGHSYAYDYINGKIYEHINEPLTPDRWEGILRCINEFATTDINGKPTVTDYHILITAMATLVSCQMLLDAGVRVINASEGGILRSNPSLPAYADKPVFPEHATLADVVGEMNKCI